ncbi:MAG: hypothetical protein KKG59_06960 [Nanoarchaeota archaeon]|nr:hypothetical protein [Nanoarchaeota archaeon]
MAEQIIKAIHGDCRADQVFWTQNGVLVHNIYELIHAVEHMDEFTFRYHVNEDNNKNDFADWIRDVFADEELAMKLEGLNDKKKYLEILKQWVE